MQSEDKPPVLLNQPTTRAAPLTLPRQPPTVPPVDVKNTPHRVAAMMVVSAAAVAAAAAAGSVSPASHDDRQQYPSPLRVSKATAEN